VEQDDRAGADVRQHEACQLLRRRAGFFLDLDAVDGPVRAGHTERRRGLYGGGIVIAARRAVEAWSPATGGLTHDHRGPAQFPLHLPLAQIRQVQVRVGMVRDLVTVGPHPAEQIGRLFRAPSDHEKCPLRLRRLQRIEQRRGAAGQGVRAVVEGQGDDLIRGARLPYPLSRPQGLPKILTQGAVGIVERGVDGADRLQLGEGDGDVALIDRPLRQREVRRFATGTGQEQRPQSCP